MKHSNWIGDVVSDSDDNIYDIYDIYSYTEQLMNENKIQYKYNLIYKNCKDIYMLETFEEK